MDKDTGQIQQPLPEDPNQPTIESFPNAHTLDRQRAFDGFKAILVRWIVYCHIAFFQFKNSYFRQLLYYMYPKLASLLPKAGKTIQKWVIYAFN